MSACALHMEFMVQTEVHHLARLNVRSRGGGKKLEVDSEITRHLIPEILRPNSGAGVRLDKAIPGDFVDSTFNQTLRRSTNTLFRWYYSLVRFMRPRVSITGLEYGISEEKYCLRM